MNALRVLAVYIGSCGAVLFLLNRYLLAIPRRTRLALALLPMLLVGRALVTGSFYGPLNLSYGTPPLAARAPAGWNASFHDGILSDVAIQMVPWRKAVREALKHGHLPVWNRFMLSGDVLLGAAQPAALSPTTLLSCLLPLATAWTFSCAFTFFLAATFMFLFLRELGLAPPPALAGGAAWMLSNFLVFFIGWPQSAVFAVLPLLCFGVHRLRTRSPGGFGATLAGLTLLALGGHPESMLHVVAAAGVFFLVELLRTRSRPVRPVLGGLAAGVLAFGLAAPVLLPFLQIAPESADHWFRYAIYAHQKKSHPPAQAAVLASAAAYPDAYGPVWESLKEPPDFLDTSNACVGGAALALAALAIWSKRRQKWSLALVGALSLAVAAGVPGVTDLVSRLPLFEVALNVRLAGIAAFCLAALAGLGMEVLIAEAGWRSWLTLVLASVVLYAGALRLRGLGLYPVASAAFTRSTILLVAPALLLALATLLRLQLPRVAFLILLGGRLVDLAPLYPTIPSVMFYPPLPELALLPSDAIPYRVTGGGYNLVPNQSVLWELEDPRGYEGLTNRRYDATVPLWSVRQASWFNRIDDLTNPFVSFLNVRFALGAPTEPVPRGWREFTRGPNCALFENPGALPRAFAPRTITFVPTLEEAVTELKSIQDFGARAILEDPPHAGTTIPNGNAQVKIRRAASALRITVDANAPTWVIVSNTGWSGWKATEHGSPIPLTHANGAFLAFHVPAGHHRVRLDYWPTSLSIGIGLALLAVSTLVALALRHRLPTRTAPLAS